MEKKKKTDHFSKNRSFFGGGGNYIFKITFICLFVYVLAHTGHSTQCRGQRTVVEVHSMMYVLGTEPSFFRFGNERLTH